MLPTFLKNAQQLKAFDAKVHHTTDTASDEELGQIHQQHSFSSSTFWIFRIAFRSDLLHV